MGGSFEQARDVFQDALVVYYEKVVTTGMAINTSEKAYLLGIVKNLWYHQFRTESVNEPLSQHETDMVQDHTPAEICSYKVLNFLETAGQKCMDLLKAFYYDKLSLNKISDDFGFSGVRSATVQKYKCLEKMREEVKERKLSYADFTE